MHSPSIVSYACALSAAKLHITIETLCKIIRAKFWSLASHEHRVVVRSGVQLRPAVDAENSQTLQVSPAERNLPAGRGPALGGPCGLGDGEETQQRQTGQEKALPTKM